MPGARRAAVAGAQAGSLPVIATIYAVNARLVPGHARRPAPDAHVNTAPEPGAPTDEHPLDSLKTGCASCSRRRSWSGRWASTSSRPSSRARCRCCRSSRTRCSTWGPPATAGWWRPPPWARSSGSLYTSVVHLPRRQGTRAALGRSPLTASATIAYGLSRSYWLVFLALAGTGLSRPRLHRDPPDPAPAPDPGRPARAHDVREHDLLHGRPAARRDGGGAGRLDLRLRRPGRHASRWSSAASLTLAAAAVVAARLAPRTGLRAAHRAEDPRRRTALGSELKVRPSRRSRAARAAASRVRRAGGAHLAEPAGRRATPSTASWSPSCARRSSTCAPSTPCA